MHQQKAGSIKAFVRGWELFGHSFYLLRASLVRHVTVALLLGCLVGVASFRGQLDDAQRSGLPAYVRASVRARVNPGGSATYLVEGRRNQMHHAWARERMRLQVYRGRSLTFLGQQLLVRAGVGCILAGLIVAALMRQFGRRSMKERRLRGATVVDSEARDRRQSSGRWGGLALGSAVAACLVSALVLGPRRVALVPEYLMAATTTSSPAAAQFFSPDARGELGWYQAPFEAGFRRNTDAYRYFREEVFGVSFRALLGRWLGAFAGIMGMGVAYFAHRHRGSHDLLRAAWRTSKGQLGELREARGNGRLRKTLLGMMGRVMRFVGETHDRRARRRPAPVLHVANAITAVDKECYHFLFCGSPGSGKSTAIKDVLRQVRDRGQRAVIYDVCGEYVELFYREGRDKILNPMDARCEPWTLWADAETPADYFAMARSLFPIGGSDPFWADAGATLFASVARVLRDRNEVRNTNLYASLVLANLKDLGELLEGTAAARFVDREAGSMPSNLLATVASKLTAWALLPDPLQGARAFSIRDFIASDDGDSWLFLSGREDQRDMLRPLVSLWCDVVARAVLSLSVDKERRIWCVLDELASLQRLPALPGLLERGRKHGAAVVMGVQSMPQLREAYGRDAAAALASQPQTWLVLRTVEPDTARWLESALGDAEVEQARESISLSAHHAGREGLSLQQQTRRQPVALATEIMSLPDMVGYLKQPGDLPVLKVRYAPKAFPVLAPAFIARTDANKKAG